MFPCRKKVLQGAENMQDFLCSFWLSHNNEAKAPALRHPVSVIPGLLSPHPSVFSDYMVSLPHSDAVYHPEKELQHPLYRAEYMPPPECTDILLPPETVYGERLSAAPCHRRNTVCA